MSKTSVHSYSTTSCLLLFSVHNDLLDDTDFLVFITTTTYTPLSFLYWSMRRGSRLQWRKLSLPRFPSHMTWLTVHTIFFYQFFFMSWDTAALHNYDENFPDSAQTRLTSIVSRSAVSTSLLLRRDRWLFPVPYSSSTRHPALEFFVRVTFWTSPSSALALYRFASATGFVQLLTLMLSDPILSRPYLQYWSWYMSRASPL